MDIMLTVQPLPAFKDNYIWLLTRPGTRHAALVDPGDARPALAALQRLGLEPCAVLVTHHHWDHTGGVAALRKQYDAPVYGPAREDIPALTHPLREGDVVDLPQLGAALRVLDVPGHTRGAIAYYGADLLFCGDTLFTAGCGRLFEGTPRQMYASLAKLAALPGATQVYCGHEYTLENLAFARRVEPDNVDIMARIRATEALRARGLPSVPATLETEQRTNPFLRCHDPDVIAAAENFAGRPLTDAAEVFAVVRHWKDVLDDD